MMWFVQQIRSAYPHIRIVLATRQRRSANSSAPRESQRMSAHAAVASRSRLTFCTRAQTYRDIDRVLV
jgi:hypothetical protein